MTSTSRLKMKPPAPSSRSDVINIQVKILPTEEKFQLKRIPLGTKISALKGDMEFVTGVPVHLQRLHYLDEGDLLDSSELRKYDFVAGALIKMEIWSVYRDLFVSVVHGDVEEVMRQGVTQDSSYNTPNSLYMKAPARREWLKERALLALYVAAHRGHLTLCRRLIESGADINGRTSLGRTPLHVVAAQGHGDIIDLLLDNGADINAVDDAGRSALDVASEYGHKACERHLFLFRWQQRARSSQGRHTEVPLMAHQCHDSAFPVWRAGPVAQVYLQNILPPGEFQGSALNAPKSKTAEDKKKHLLHSSGYSEEPEAEDTQNAKIYVGFGRSKSPKKISFDHWLKKKQKAEQILINKRKAEEQRRKDEEEDQSSTADSESVLSEDDLRKRAAEEKQESYETWLAQQESRDNPQRKGRGRRRQQKEPEASIDHDAPPASDTKTKKFGSTEEPRGKERTMYEDWLYRRENELLENIVNNATVLDTPRVFKAA